MLRRLVFVVALLVSSVAFGQTTVRVPSVQDLTMSGSGGTILAATSCTDSAAHRTTANLFVGPQARVVIAVTYADTAGSTTAIDVICRGSYLVGTSFSSAYILPTIVSTSAAGVSTMVEGTWEFQPSGGGLLGSVTYTQTIASLPLPYLACRFSCVNGGAADTVSAKILGVTP